MLMVAGFASLHNAVFEARNAGSRVVCGGFVVGVKCLKNLAFHKPQTTIVNRERKEEVC
jgi:hypothetical protein